MRGAVWPKIRDALITFAAVYAALTLAGSIRVFFPPLEALRVLAMALYMLLLCLYSVATPAGRRAGWLTYLLCGLLCPLAVVALALGALSFPLSYEAYSATEVLSAGFSVGVRITGSSDPALGASTLLRTFLLWWLGLAGATVAVVALRGAVRRSGATRASAG